MSQVPLHPGMGPQFSVGALPEPITTICPEESVPRFSVLRSAEAQALQPLPLLPSCRLSGQLLGDPSGVTEMQ